VEVELNIVGLKYHNIDRLRLKKIVENQITLVKEPTNKFDKFAVQCWSDGHHFGYIEATVSQKITYMLNKSNDYLVDVLTYDDFKVRVLIYFEIPKVEYQYLKMPDGDLPGIYEISFMLGATKYCYIGQSGNINRRLQSHYHNLSNLQHHNDLVQKAWLDDKSKFIHRIIEFCPENLGKLDRQIFLFKREIFHIKNSKIPTVNKIDADLVFTKEAFKEIQSLVHHVKSQLKQERLLIISEKEKIGQRIIDLGIIKEERFWDGYQRAGEADRYLEIKASNILTWLNKSRYGTLDYRPKINSDHPMFDNLKENLNAKHQKVSIIDHNRRFLDNFTSAFKNKGKHETCKIEQLDKFLEIISDHSTIKHYGKNGEEKTTQSNEKKTKKPPLQWQLQLKINQQDTQRN